MKVLEGLPHGVRCGQVYRDPKKRELEVRHVLDEIDKALCVVVSEVSGRQRRSALVQLDRFTSKGWKLTRDVSDAEHRCAHCKGSEPRVFHPTGNVRFCMKPTCRAVAQARAKVLREERERAEKAGPIFGGGGSS